MALRNSNKQQRVLPARPPVTHVIAKAEQAAGDVLKALEKLRAKQLQRKEAGDYAAALVPQPKFMRNVPLIATVPTTQQHVRNNVSRIEDDDIFGDAPVVPPSGPHTLRGKSSVAPTGTALPTTDFATFTAQTEYKAEIPTHDVDIPETRRHSSRAKVLISPEGEDLLSASVIRAVDELTSPTHAHTHRIHINNAHISGPQGYSEKEPSVNGAEKVPPKPVGASRTKDTVATSETKNFTKTFGFDSQTTENFSNPFQSDSRTHERSRKAEPESEWLKSVWVADTPPKIAAIDARAKQSAKKTDTFHSHSTTTPNGYNRRTTAHTSQMAAHKLRVTGKALRAAVDDMRQQHRRFRAESCAMLTHTQQAIDKMVDNVRSKLKDIDTMRRAEKEKMNDVLHDLHITRKEVAARDAHIMTLQHQVSTLAGRVSQAEADASAYLEQARRLRDALAEVKGCIRVVARMRPVLTNDFRDGSASRIVVQWLLGYAMQLSKFKRNHAAQLMMCKLLGWPGSFEDLLKAVGLGSATARISALSESPLATDIGPVCIPAPPLSDASKEVALALAPLQARAFFDAVDESYSGTDAGASLSNTLGSAAAADGSAFHFDKMFWPQHNQMDIFEEVRVMLDAAFRGKNVCVMAHGATSSGKTHTLFGDVRETANAYEVTETDGLAVRCCEYLLRQLSKAVHSSSEPAAKRCKRLSIMIFEVYNDEMRDLLRTMKPEPKVGTMARGPIRAEKVRAPTKSTTAKVDDIGQLGHVDVTSLDVFKAVLSDALALRASGVTASNDTSSRSHCVIRLMLRDDSELEGSAKVCKPVSIIHLCDLAGAERTRESRVSGAMLTEACHVNTSLTALSDCISALIKGAGHVPFRNSTLTKLLEPTLLSPSRVLMIANISPLSQQREQALQTLRFAAKCSASREQKVSKTDAQAAVAQFLDAM